MVARVTRIALRPALVFCLAVLATGCETLAREEGRLPDAVRAGLTRLSAQGYPDLTKIPEVPKTLPNAAAWQKQEKDMLGQARALAADPSARALQPDDTNLAWAEAARAALESDARAQPLPTGADAAGQGKAWADEARAKLDAELAALPPL
ncbi:MAG: hypothetical protein RL186_691 [Pseudomonadota bacterium]